MHKYAVDNYESVISFSDLTNGFLMELAANCQSYNDCVYIVARLIKEDMLYGRSVQSVASKIRFMYRKGANVIKLSVHKRMEFKALLEKPFELPAIKSSAPSSRASTPTLYNRGRGGSVKLERRGSAISAAGSSNGSIGEGYMDSWDPHADELGDDFYDQQYNEELRSEVPNLAKHIATIVKVSIFLANPPLMAKLFIFRF